MDNFLKYIVAAGAGAGILYLIQQNQLEKSQPNPEAEIEAELDRRNQLDYKPDFTKYNFSRDD